MTLEAKLHDALLKPHPSVTHPIERKICHLMALLCLLFSPVPLALFYLRQMKSEVALPFTPELNILATILIMMSFGFSRSKYWKVSCAIHLAIALLFPLFFTLAAPNNFNVTVHLTIPVILAGIYFGKRAIISVALIAEVGAYLVYSNASASDSLLLVHTGVAVAVTALLVYFVRAYFDWLTLYRKAAMNTQVKRYDNLAKVGFDGTATLTNDLLQEVSEGFANTLCRSKYQLEGQKLTSIIPAFKPSENRIDTYSFQTDEGSTRHVTIASNRLANQVIFLALRDITDERNRQVQQLQMDRMTATGTLAAGIAHELNNPLMVAMNQTRISLRELGDDHYDQLSRRLGVLDNALSQIATIVSDLKWFVQSALDDELSPTRDVIENTVRLANHRIRPYCRVHLELRATEPTVLHGSGLAQVVTNLLFNAADAKPENKTFTTVSVRTWSSETDFFLEVKDDGIGISKAVIERIFEPFFTHGKHSGTGLGLAICQSLVHNVGGSIRVQSAPEEGCTFTVTIPLAKPPAPTVSPSTEQSSVRSILVIDDDPVLPELIAEFLNEFECIFTDNITEAISLLKRHHIDAILCDVNMPCGGASALHSYLRKTEDELAERMIVITGGAVNVPMQSFIDQVQQPVVYKPFRADQITEAIGTLKLNLRP